MDSFIQGTKVGVVSLLENREKKISDIKTELKTAPKRRYTAHNLVNDQRQSLAHSSTVAQELLHSPATD